MTGYGICELSMIPVRKQPSDQSEMVNQLLFGDTVIIQDFKDWWYNIISSHDMYEGWVDVKQIKKISKSEFESINEETSAYITSHNATVETEGEKIINLAMGSRLPLYDNDKCKIAEKEYITCGEIATTSELTKCSSVCELALKYMGTPYLWGGRSPYGIDCSGFVQVIYRMFGIFLKRDSGIQVESGITIDFLEDVIPGDLAFFDNQDGNIVHVGILLNKTKIIHASGEVRIDKIDHNGIYNEKELKYTHKLRIIKRIKQV